MIVVRCVGDWDVREAIRAKSSCRTCLVKGVVFFMNELLSVKFYGVETGIRDLGFVWLLWVSSGPLV